MPRIRTIKPEFYGDEKMAPMCVLDRFVFLGLISMADDAGRIVDNVKSIDGFIFPETEDSSRESLARLSDAGRIIRYVAVESGQRLIQLRHWKRHQKVDHPSAYVLAAPQDSDLLAKPSRESFETLARLSRSDQYQRPVPTTSTNDLRPAGADAPRVNTTGGIPAKVKVKPADAEGFADCWAVYPKRPGNSRIDALKHYRRRLGEGVSPADLLAGTERYAQYCAAMGWVGSNSVRNAERFYGEGRGWADDWAIPPGTMAVSMAPGASPVADLLAPEALRARFAEHGLTHVGDKATYPARIAASCPATMAASEWDALVRRLKPWNLGDITFGPDVTTAIRQRLAQSANGNGAHATAGHA